MNPILSVLVIIAQCSWNVTLKFFPSHVLVLVLSPSPQDVLHWDHGAHSLQYGHFQSLQLSFSSLSPLHKPHGSLPPLPSAILKNVYHFHTKWWIPIIYYWGEGAFKEFFNEITLLRLIIISMSLYFAKLFTISPSDVYRILGERRSYLGHVVGCLSLDCILVKLRIPSGLMSLCTVRLTFRSSTFP